MGKRKRREISAIDMLRQSYIESTGLEISTNEYAVRPFTVKAERFDGTKESIGKIAKLLGVEEDACRLSGATLVIIDNDGGLIDVPLDRFVVLYPSGLCNVIKEKTLVDSFVPLAGGDTEDKQVWL